jgi:hypothetical protein
VSVDHQEAAAALDSVEEIGSRVKTIHLYRSAAPFLVMWGGVWLVTNAVTDFRPSAALIAWIFSGTVGAIGTVIISIVNSRKWTDRNRPTAKEARAIGQRFSMIGITIILYFPVMLAVFGPFTGRQLNAFISLFWTFAYMLAGAIIGWKLFAIGLTATVAIAAGFLFLHTHFLLWMALVGGGALMAGGLWLKKI